MWLRNEEDNKAYFPTETGRFRLDGSFLYGCVLIVEGPDLPPQAGLNSARTVSSTAASNGSGASASFQSNPTPPPLFRSVIPNKGKEGTTFPVKIVKAKMVSCKTGKVDFSAISQMHIDLNESSANVEHVLEEIRKRWGEEYNLVTVDGLKLEDCEGNRGIVSIYFRGYM